MARASLHVLSEARLDIGLGLGWSAAEYAAVGATHMDTGRGLIVREVNSCGCTLEALTSSGSPASRPRARLRGFPDLRGAASRRRMNE